MSVARGSSSTSTLGLMGDRGSPRGAAGRPKIFVSANHIFKFSFFFKYKANNRYFFITDAQLHSTKISHEGMQWDKL